MNAAQNLQDQSYYTMIAEHQKLAERVLRLHELLDQHPCIQYMPTQACSIINEMKNIVMTGNAQPDGIESFDLEFDENQLPFVDEETKPGRNQILRQWLAVKWGRGLQLSEEMNVSRQYISKVSTLNAGISYEKWQEFKKAMAAVEAKE